MRLIIPQNSYSTLTPWGGYARDLMGFPLESGHLRAVRKESDLPSSTQLTEASQRAGQGAFTVLLTEEVGRRLTPWQNAVGVH